MVSIEESEKLGNALNILEMLNSSLLKLNSKLEWQYGRERIFRQIKNVIEFMDGVVC